MTTASMRKLVPLCGVFFLLAVTAYAQAASQAASPCAAKWESEIKKFEEADRQSAPPQGGVLFIGSSSIRGWHDLKKDFPSATVLNRGFGGSEIADSTCFADRIVIPYRPKLVVFYAGGNDLANGKRPRRVFSDFQDFVARVRRDLPDTRIAFISIAPNPARWHLVESVKEVNASVKNYAERAANLTYVDVFTQMLGANGQPRPELFIEDKLHMNREGYDLWRTILAPLVR